MSAWPKLFLLTCGALLATALPTWLVSATPPSATFFNQAAAMGGWGLWVGLTALMILDDPRAHKVYLLNRGLSSVWLLSSALLLALVASGWHSGLPLSLVTGAAGLLAAVALTIHAGHVVSRTGGGTEVFTALCTAMALAAAANTGVALVQVFAPQWTDGVWIASTSAAIAGRASGNVRQPNHLSSLLLWGLAALVWLADDHRRATASAASKTAGKSALTAVGLLLCAGLVLAARAPAPWACWCCGRHGRPGPPPTARRPPAPARPAGGLRPALVGVEPLAAPPRRQRRNRRPLQPARRHFRLPLQHLVQRLGPAPAAPMDRRGLGRLQLRLVAHALSPPAHGLLRQRAQPAAAPGGRAWACRRRWSCVACWAMRCGVPCGPGWRAPGIRGPMGTTAGVMVLVMALHSLLEYPLWYAYFLLPTGFLWGLCLGLPSPSLS